MGASVPLCPQGVFNLHRDEGQVDSSSITCHLSGTCHSGAIVNQKAKAVLWSISTNGVEEGGITQFILSARTSSMSN